MIIKSQAPSRISLFGGGTDVDPYASKYGGFVISLAISLRSHVTIYTDDELFSTGSNQFPVNADPKLFYEIARSFNMGGGHAIKFKSTFDGIIGAGLGSSASASVALIGALYKHSQLPFDRNSIATAAWDIEVNKMGWLGGKQDQWIAAYGGMNVLEIGKDVEIMRIGSEFSEAFLPYLCLYYTGGTRDSRTIQSGFRHLDARQIKALDQMKDIAQDALRCLTTRDFRKVGKLLDESWKLKKISNPKATSPKINKIYTIGRKSGAWGGKVLGAGGCGYMFFICDPTNQNKLDQTLSNEGIERVDFSIDYTGVEARIV